MSYSFLKRFLSLAGGEVFGKIVTFAAFAYLARMYGPGGFGIIEWAGAVLIFAGLIVEQGFNIYGAREIAKDRDRIGGLVAEIVTAKFLFALTGYALVALLAVNFASERELVVLLLMYGASLLLHPFMLQWVFLGRDKVNFVAITQIIRQFVFASLVFIFVNGETSLLMVGAAEIAAVFAAALFSVIAYRIEFGVRILFRPSMSATLFRVGFPIGLSQILSVAKIFGATLIIGFIATARDTGLFAGSMRIFTALHTFVWLYFYNLLPSFSRAWSAGSESLRAMIGTSMRVVLAFGLIIGILWVAFAPYAMTAVYGGSFVEGGLALRWLAGAFLASAISGHYRYGLIAAGHQNKEMYGSALGAVLVIALVPFGYFRWGISGAAAFVFLSETIVLAFVWVLARNVLHGGGDEDLEAGGGVIRDLQGSVR